MSTRFYAYLWLREDGTPYYAGKGSGRRAFISENHCVGRPKDPSRIIIMYRDTEAEAFATEMELIANWGRKDIGTGCLRNMSDGGENPPRGTKETYLKIAAARRGQKTPEATRRKISKANTGKRHTEATRQKISEANFKRFESQEARDALSKAHIGQKGTGRKPGTKNPLSWFEKMVGRKLTEEHKKRIAAANMGRTSYWKGKSLPPEMVAKMHARHRGALCS